MTEQALYEELLQMRENYRSHPLDDMRLRRPRWLEADDPLSELFEKKADLFRNGQIVFARIVQANVILFEAFPRVDCPALLVFSADPFFLEHPEILRRLSAEIFRYKNRDPDEVPEEWKEAAAAVTDEQGRPCFTLSAEYDGRTVEYHMTATILFRKLLPRGRLCGGLLPVLTVPDCKRILVLPKQYWTEKFRNAWVRGAV